MIVVFLVTQAVGTAFSWQTPGYVKDLTYILLPAVCFAVGAGAWTNLSRNQPQLARRLIGNRN